ncbi:MAG: methyl-accepting chemotaxis protein [Magnetococcales bacterium]|nr:methyl-accepting chemotaxis protein [Magnetococcales bacterium]
MSGKVAEQANMLDEFRDRMNALSLSNQNIKSVVQVTLQATDKAVAETETSQKRLAQSVVNIQGLVSQVAEGRTLLDGFQKALDEVSKVVRTIDNIAKQTNLLALNASIIASKAGDAGKGFAVVAAEVKSLAQETTQSTERIEDSVAALRSQADLLRNQTETSAQCAQGVGSDAEAIGGVIETIGQMIREVGSEAARITGEADEINNHCDQLGGIIQSASQGVHASSNHLEGASANLKKLLSAGERLIAITINSPVATSNTPFVHQCLSIAQQINTIFASGAKEGAFQEKDFFLQDYASIPDSDPAQFATPYLSFTDQAIQPILDEALKFHENVVFCCILDRKGYLPTHNSKYSHSQGKDPVWNNANCRNRRFFNDRVGLAAANNTEPFLVQTYRRDMGGGKKVLMMDVSAPIMINGRHWGAVRLAFKPT